MQNRERMPRKAKSKTAPAQKRSAARRSRKEPAGIGEVVDLLPHVFDPKRGLLRLNVKLAADREAVDPVVQSVMKMVRQIKCANGKEDAVELALSEALANAVIHGAKADSRKTVECDVACDENRGIVIVVRDPGKGFDPRHIPSPLVGQNVYAGNGRGIYLINQLMDHVEFHRNGAEIHMHKK